MSEFGAQVPSAQDDKDRLDARRHEGRFAHRVDEDVLRKYLRAGTGNQVRPRDIMTAVEEVLTEKYGPPRLRTLPAGLRLEMHPGVALLFMASDDGLFRFARRIPEDLFTVPVLVTMHIPEGSWRLVIVTEEVLLGGTTGISPPGGSGPPAP